MDSPSEHTPTKYYIDFENVHGAGLKGVDELDEHDEVFVFYSQAAETFHIEQAIDIMKSKARIEFVEIDGGTRNSLDFQLVAALFGTMTEGFEYAIVSGDGGFDAAIKMGQRLELPSVRRITDLTGSTESPQSKSTRQKRTRNSRQKDKKEQAEQETTPVQQKLPAAKEPQQLPAPAHEEAGGDAKSAVPEKAEEAGAKPAEKTGGRKRRSSRRSAAKKAETQETDAAQPDNRAEAQNGRETPEQGAKHVERAGTDTATEAATPAASDTVPAGAEATTSVEPARAPAGAEATTSVEPARAPAGAEATTSVEPAQAPASAEATTKDAASAVADDKAAMATEATSSEEQDDATPASKAPETPIANESPADRAPEDDDVSGSEDDTDDAEEKEADSAPTRSGRYSKRKEVKALLVENGVTLNQQQLSSVMKALNGVKNKQGFYRSIIQAEKQERGLELYRQVRDHYEAMVEILRS